MAQQSKSKGSSKMADTAGLPATSNVTSNVPDFMRQDSRLGKENISQQDMVIPRIALLQAVHPEVMEGRGDNGNFWHTVNELDLGPEIDDIVWLHISKRYTLWNPRHAGGGILARASDGINWDQPGEFQISPYKDRPKYTVTLQTGKKVGKDIGLGAWGTLDPENPDSPPAATLTYALAGIRANNPEMGPFVVLLQRSAEPVARMLLSKIQLDPAPLFGQVYRMGSKVQPSNNGDFNQYTFTKNGHVQTQEQYEEFKKLHEGFAATGVKFDETAEQPEDVAAGDAGDSGDDKY